MPFLRKLTFLKWGFPVSLALLPLSAQAPPGWNQNRPLGYDQPGQPGQPGPGAWYGAGLWAGDHHGQALSLTDSLGLGNSLTGGGFHLEAGYRWNHWDFAAEVLGDRSPDGQAFLTLYRSHLWYQGDSGWQGGFEQEPLVWGFGLHGGYLLGEADRPFPRVRIVTPMADLHIGPVPLGAWGLEGFVGRMENHPVLSTSIQDASWRSRAIEAVGNPEAPLLMGYRAKAEFGPLMELYLNYLNLWSGTLNGRGLTSGYGLGNYFTAITGLKDTLAEANTDFTNPTPAPAKATNVVSASEADVGFRLQSPALARALAAEKVHLYVSRGSKAMVWPVGVFIKDPLRYGAKDVSKDISNILLSPNLGAVWNQNSRYTLPSLAEPNDTVGILADWTGVRAGLEYYAGVNGLDTGHRPFAHGTYLTGFYYHGDPLGNSMGGEVIATTAKVEWDVTSRLTLGTWLTRGFRPFRDNLADWLLDHPGQTPGKDRLTGLEQTVDWKLNAITSLKLGASWQRQGAVEYAVGRTANAFAWYSDLAFRWPARR